MDWVWNVREPLRVDALRKVFVFVFVLGVDGSVGNFSLLLFFPPLLNSEVRRRSRLRDP